MPVLVLESVPVCAAGSVRARHVPEARNLRVKQSAPSRGRLCSELLVDTDEIGRMCNGLTNVLRRPRSRRPN